MKDPHLGQVARVIAHHHALADIRREGGVYVAHALKAHAVRMNLAHLGNGQKQQVEMLQRFRHARDKSAMLPTLLGRNLGFAVRPRVVLAKEFAEAAIEVRHGQFCPDANGAGVDVFRLPDLVRAFGFTPLNQVVGFAIGLLAIQGEGLRSSGMARITL